MMATVPLSTLQTLQAELKAWQVTAKREREARQQAEALLERLREWIEEQHEADHAPAYMVEGCDVCHFLLADPLGTRLAEEQRALEPRNELEAWLVDREREERAALEKCYETLRTVHPRECPTYGEPGHLDTCRGCIISDALFAVDRVRTDRRNAAVEHARQP